MVTVLCEGIQSITNGFSTLCLSAVGKLGPRKVQKQIFETDLMQQIMASTPIAQDLVSLISKYTTHPNSELSERLQLCNPYNSTSRLPTTPAHEEKEQFPQPVIDYVQTNKKYISSLDLHDIPLTAGRLKRFLTRTQLNPLQITELNLSHCGLVYRPNVGAVHHFYRHEISSEFSNDRLRHCRQDLEYLSSFRNLETLDLSYNLLMPLKALIAHDVLFRPLVALDKLRTLKLRNTFSDSAHHRTFSLGFCQKLPQLTELDVSENNDLGSQISHATLFAQIPVLKKLIMKSCRNMTQEFRDELKRLRPDIELVADAPSIPPSTVPEGYYLQVSPY